MNLSPSWVDFLTGAGFTAVHWSDEGAPDASDHVLMQWAAEREYIVLTADLDFAAILAATERQGPSVILVRNAILTPDVLGSAVLAAIHQAKKELATGAIISVDAERARLRILPLEGR
jgi:predicted nuclease of predicted toxin-antitoxin system